MISIFLLILIQWFQPFDSKFANKLETFNELTTMAVLYTLMLFSDYIREPVVRSSVGIAYMSVIVVFAIVHLAPMLCNTLKQIHR